MSGSSTTPDPAPSRVCGGSLSVGWAAAALLSNGMLAWAAFLYASRQTGLWRWRGWAIAYFLLGLGAASIVAIGARSHGTAGIAFLAPSILLAITSSLHTLAIRPQYAERMRLRSGLAFASADPTPRRPSTTAEAVLPLELPVVAGARAHYAGGGWLLIEDGRLTLRLGAAVWVATQGLQEIVQTVGVVKLVWPRWVAPLGGGPVLILHDDVTGEIAAVQRDRWRTPIWPPPLHAAGFATTDVTTWFSLTAEPGWGKPPSGLAHEAGHDRR